MYVCLCIHALVSISVGTLQFESDRSPDLIWPKDKVNVGLQVYICLQIWLDQGSIYVTKI